jgi:hypothetical protein
MEKVKIRFNEAKNNFKIWRQNNKFHFFLILTYNFFFKVFFRERV